MTHRFIGSEAEIGGVRLRRLGDPITLSDSRAEDAIVGAGSEQGFAGAIAILPVETFDKIFTEEDVEQYAEPGARAIAGAEFRQKQKAALEALHELRLSYENEAAKAAAAQEKAKAAAQKKGGK